MRERLAPVRRRLSGLPRTPSRTAAFSMAAAIVVTLLVWVAAGRGGDALLIAAISIGGATLVGWLIPSHPVAAFGVLFILASISRPTLHLPVGTMRIEQPAIAVALVTLVLLRRWPTRRALRWLLPVGLAFGAYLVILLASSLLKAPDRADSLHLVVWTAISMAGGLAAVVLLSRRAAGAGPWLQATGAMEAVVGVAAALGFLVLGPVIVPAADPAPGIQNALSSLPKVYGYAWEANLYASLLGAMAPFAVDGLRRRRTVRDGIVLALILVGFALGFTRGAYLGLIAGLLVYAAVAAWRSGSVSSLVAPAVLTIAILGLGTAASGFLLPTGRPTTAPLADRIAALITTLERPSGPGPGASLRPGESPPPGASPTPSPVATPPPPPPDTLSFRLDRLPMAIADLSHSPIIGLGADSFGQRHADPSQADRPDHLAIMAIAVLYESGILGAVALAIGFLIVLFALLRVSGRPGRAGLAAAFLGSIISLLVAYQATNALHFAINWLILGAALALVVEERSAEPTPGASGAPVEST